LDTTDMGGKFVGVCVHDAHVHCGHGRPSQLLLSSCNLLTCIWRPIGMTPLEFGRGIQQPKTIDSLAIVFRCLRDPIRLAVSVEHRLVALSVMLARRMP